MHSIEHSAGETKINHDTELLYKRTEPFRVFNGLSLIRSDSCVCELGSSPLGLISIYNSQYNLDT